jgi:hypothetical protein
MRALRKTRSDLIPLIATITVAVVGAAGILSDDLGIRSGSQAGGNPRMITAAAVSRAGAIETPTDTNPSKTFFVPAARTTATSIRRSV